MGDKIIISSLGQYLTLFYDWFIRVLVDLVKKRLELLAQDLM